MWNRDPIEVDRQHKKYSNKKSAIGSLAAVLGSAGKPNPRRPSVGSLAENEWGQNRGFIPACDQGSSGQLI
jgi:hypothetical protein